MHEFCILQGSAMTFSDVVHKFYSMPNQEKDSVYQKY